MFLHVCIYSNPLAAAHFELAELKQVYQAQALEKGKLKQKLMEETSTSLVKVCSWLHACMVIPF